MAEFVEQRMQEMIKEINELEKFEILQETEIKQLIKNRREFEYKICKQKKEKQDFMNYILYEIKLLELIDLRRKKLMNFKRRHQIEGKISVRVFAMLRLMTRLWSTHDVWKLKISFAKSQKFNDEVTATYSEQTRIQGDDESVWINWAQWEIEGRKNFDKAREILLSRAPLYHPDSLSLAREYFRLELMYVEHLKSKFKGSNKASLEETDMEKALAGEIANTVYISAAEKFNCAKLYVEFFKVAKLFPFAKKISNKILSDLMNNFPNDIETIKLRAHLLIFDGVKLNKFSLEQNAVDENFILLEKCKISENINEDLVENSQISDKNNKNGDKIVVNKSENINEDLVENSKISDDENCDKNVNKSEKNCDKLNVWSKVTVKSPYNRLILLLKLYAEVSLAPSSPVFNVIVEDLFKLFYEVFVVQKFVDPIVLKIYKLYRLNLVNLSPEQFIIWFHVASFMKKKRGILKGILKTASKLHSDCQILKLEYFKHFGAKMKFEERRAIMSKFSGTPGAELCKILIKKSPPTLRKKLYDDVFNHSDVCISKILRIFYLHRLRDINKARKHYEKYNRQPPFNIEFHQAMLKVEFSQEEIAPLHVRSIFECACDQFGDSDPGLWLCYIEFERKIGNLRKVSQLEESSYRNLKAELREKFTNAKFAVKNSLADNLAIEKNNLCKNSDNSEDLEKYKFWLKSTQPNIFEEEVTLTYSALEEREKLFEKFALVKKQFHEAGKSTATTDSFVRWQELCSVLCGVKINFTLKKVALDIFTTADEIKNFVNEIDRAESHSKKLEANSPKVKKEMEPWQKALEISEVLKPDFQDKKQISPYFVSKNAIQINRRKERSKTAGEAWYNMKAPEATLEISQDLEALQMRSILNPKRHYKRSDMKKAPKFFQMGTVVDSPGDMYSSRIPKKERRKNITDEIMRDEAVLSYQKRKYQEIVAERESKRRKFGRARSGNSKKLKDNWGKKKSK